MQSDHLELQEQQASLQNSLLSDSDSSQSELQLSILPEKGMKLNRNLKAMEANAAKQNPQSQEIQEVLNAYEDYFTQTKNRSKIPFALPVIRPSVIVVWKLCVALMIIFVFFEVPVYVMFGPEFWLEIMPKSGIDALFYSIAFILVVDIGLDFITAYYKHGNLVTDSSKIAKHYLYGYFIFDCFALIASVSRLSVMSQHYRWVYFAFYFKYPSLTRIDDQIGQMILLHKKLRTFYQVLKMLIFMFFTFNMGCCIFYRIGLYSVGAGMNSWLNNPGNFGTIIDLPIHQIYFFAFYFSLGTLSTTMGYGDISPMNIYECSLALTEIMFAVMVFALNINSFQLLMEEYNAYDLKIFKHRVCINKFMETKLVPSELKERVRQYLNQYWYEEGTRDIEMEQQIFQKLAPELKQELMYYSYGAFLQTTWFAKHFSKFFLKELSLYVKEVSYAAGEIIIIDKSNEQVDDFSFYYVISGQISMKPGDSQYINKKVVAGELFGELSFLTGFPRTATAEAKLYSQLYKISRADFLEVLSRFPVDFEKYCELRDEIMFSENFEFMGKSCWTCGRNGHMAITCPLTHHNPPTSTIIENNTTLDSKQDRLQLERFKRKQWPTRVNSQTLIKGLNKQKLKKQVTLMLKTQRTLLKINSPKKKTGVKSISKEFTIEPFKKSESQEIVEQFQGQDQQQLQIKISPEVSTEQKKASIQSMEKENPMFDSQEIEPGPIAYKEQIQIPSIGSSQLKSSQLSESQEKKPNKLEEYSKIAQPYIHKGVDKFDMPANFKNYYKKCNSQNYKVFRGIATTGLPYQDPIINQNANNVNLRKSFYNKNK